MSNIPLWEQMTKWGKLYDGLTVFLSLSDAITDYLVIYQYYNFWPLRFLEFAELETNKIFFAESLSLQLQMNLATKVH